MRLDAGSLIDGFLRTVAVGDVTSASSLVSAVPALANTAGEHPLRSGRPRAIQVAAESGNTVMVDVLLDAGADPNGGAEEYDGWCALHLAVQPHPSVALRLLSRGAAVDIWAAAMLGSVDEVHACLRRRSSVVVAPGPNQAPPLHFASTVETADALLRAGADLWAEDQYGRDAARCAAYAGRARRLVAGFLVTLTGEMDLPLASALADPVTVARLLDELPETIDALDGERLGPSAGRGPAPLHIAVGLGEAEIARLLLERGADPNVRSADGHGPLHYAAKHGHDAIATLLLVHGADATLRDDEHHATPRQWAERFGHAAMVKMLS